MSEKKEGYTFRCMRCLGGRIFVPYHESKARCPYCGQGWRVTWVTPEIAKIRGRILNGGESDAKRSDC